VGGSVEGEGGSVVAEGAANEEQGTSGAGGGGAQGASTVARPQFTAKWHTSIKGFAGISTQLTDLLNHEGRLQQRVTKKLQGIVTKEVQRQTQASAQGSTTLMKSPTMKEAKKRCATHRHCLPMLPPCMRGTRCEGLLRPTLA